MAWGEVQVDGHTVTGKEYDFTSPGGGIGSPQIMGYLRRPILWISSVSGTFQVDEEITGGTSEATGTIKRVEDDHLRVVDVTGTFEASETITGGTSSATATVDSALVTDTMIRGVSLTIADKAVVYVTDDAAPEVPVDDVMGDYA